MTAYADRWVHAGDWSRIASLVGLQPCAAAADVIAALERRGVGEGRGACRTRTARGRHTWMPPLRSVWLAARPGPATGRTGGPLRSRRRHANDPRRA